jgi:hypothetical protein
MSQEGYNRWKISLCDLAEIFALSRYKWIVGVGKWESSINCPPNSELLSIKKGTQPSAFIYKLFL